MTSVISCTPFMGRLNTYREDIDESHYYHEESAQPSHAMVQRLKTPTLSRMATVFLFRHYPGVSNRQILSRLIGCIHLFLIPSSLIPGDN
jgi:hypothetical protein